MTIVRQIEATHSPTREVSRGAADLENLLRYVTRVASNELEQRNATEITVVRAKRCSLLTEMVFFFPSPITSCELVVALRTVGGRGRGRERKTRKSTGLFEAFRSRAEKESETAFTYRRHKIEGENRVNHRGRISFSLSLSLSHRVTESSSTGSGKGSRRGADLARIGEAPKREFRS